MVTYSIVGRDAVTGDLGVAVQSQAFNCGAGVPWAWAGVGAIATQAFTDRRYGWRGLEMLASGMAPQDVLTDLRVEDSLAPFRQVGILSADGRTAQWTGGDCVPQAGGVAGNSWIAQANTVHSQQVWEAMGEVFTSSQGSLAERLMLALDAAEAEGGDWRGRAAAALVVVPARGERWERIIDLRVEESPEPLAELRRLLDRALAYRETNRAAADRAGLAATRGLPDSHVRLLSLEDAVEAERFEDAAMILSELEREDPRWRDYVLTLSRYPGMETFARLLTDR